MFGLPSITKLMLIAAVIAAVWYLWRRGQAARGGGTNRDTNAGSARGKQAHGPNQKPIEDMVQCKACGAYVSAKTGCSCGQASR